MRPSLALLSRFNCDLTISLRIKIMELGKEALENLALGRRALVVFRGLVMDALCEEWRKSTNQLLSQKVAALKRVPDSVPTGGTLKWSLAQ